MKLAALDIGSNAIRLQIIRPIKEKDLLSFKKVEYIRFPLRLGKDSFEKGRLEPATLARFEKLMRTFKLLMELYEVEDYLATATSAMREAANGKDIVQQIATYFDLKIDIISGDEEAGYLSKAIIPFLDSKTHVHIDVGGGSSELNLYVKKERVSSKSFKIGSVRKLNGDKRKAIFKQMKEWVNSEIPGLKGPVVGVGTGGNIKKLFQLSNQKYNGSISLTELKALKAYVSEFDYTQRIKLLKLNPDRADVILPASEIYIEVMKLIGADQMLVPRVGLIDGLLYSLYENRFSEDIKDIQFID